jgi:hypothetical protein
VVLELLLLVSFGWTPDFGIVVLDVGLLLPLLPSRYHHGEYIYIYYTRLYCKIIQIDWFSRCQDVLILEIVNRWVDGGDMKQSAESEEIDR